MDIGGQTALEVARGTGHPEVAALLKQADEANTVAAEPQNRSRRQEAEGWMSQGQCVDRGNAEQRDKPKLWYTASEKSKEYNHQSATASREPALDSAPRLARRAQLTEIVQRERAPLDNHARISFILGQTQRRAVG